MSTTRSLRNRSSRYSSPATFANSADTTSSVQQTIEGQSLGNGPPPQSRLDTWVEPLVRNGVPSFEDTKGLERVGVLEHMQPLGMGPNPKILQKLKLNLGNRLSLSARETPGYSEGVASPSLEPTKLEVASPVDPEIIFDAPPPAPPLSQPPPPPSEPLNHHLQAPPQEMTPESISPPRGRPARREVEEMKYIPEDSPLFSTVMRSATRTSRASPRNASIQEHVRDEKMRNYLEQAIRRAEREGRIDVAAGLRTTLDEVKSESKLLTALEAIISNGGLDVSREHYKTFKHQIKKGVRHYRRSPESFVSRDQASSSSQPQPVGYLSQWPTKKRSPTESSTDHRNVQNESLTLRTLPTGYFANDSPSKLALHSPSTLEIPPNDIPNFAELSNLSNIPAASTPRKRRYSNASSMSSLSSAQSLAPPTPGLANLGRHAISEGRATRSSAGQRQDTTQVALNDRTRLSGTDFLQQPLFPPKPSYPGLNTTNSQASKKIKLTHTVSDEDAREIEEQRKIFQSQIVRDHDYHPPIKIKLSNLRPELDESRSFQRLEPRQGPPPPVIHSNPLFQSAEVLSPTSQQGDLGVIGDGARRRGHDDAIADDQSSLSDAISVSLPTAPTNARHSVGVPSTRASTPRAAKEPRRQRHPRMMVSPNKPRSTINVAGSSNSARMWPGRDVVAADQDSTMEEQPENEDRCRSCGGGGHLVCCDSCPNSFHLDCLEPPLDSVPQGDWDCPECVARKRPKHHLSGFMDTLVGYVSDTILRNYSLPTNIREYFENVKTGEDGQYEEVPAPVTNKRGAARPDHHGALRPPNYREVRDNKGNVRFCYKCGLTTGGDREMVPCDFCTNEWHLDCLDPPLATPPKRFIDGKAIGSWHCPLHVEPDYRAVARAAGAAPGDLGRKPRLRRPKNAEARPPSSHIRQPNNGVIDVALEPEEPLINIKEVEMGSGVFRLPEEGIKLDFLARAQRDWYFDHAIPQSRDLPPTHFHTRSWLPDVVQYRAHQSAQSHQDFLQKLVNNQDDLQSATSNDQSAEVIDSDTFRREAHVKLSAKTFIEQQTALNLLALASQSGRQAALTSGGKQNKHHTTGLRVSMDSSDTHKIEDLIDRLVTDAPPEVVDLAATAEEEQLLRLQTLVEQRIRIIQIQKQQRTRGGGKGNNLSKKVNGTLGHNHEE